MITQVCNNISSLCNEITALAELENFDDKWGCKYPEIAMSLRDCRANLSTYFKYPQGVSAIVYTTNVIEGFNHQHRKVTKNNGIFPTDDSLSKTLYLTKLNYKLLDILMTTLKPYNNSTLNSLKDEYKTISTIVDEMLSETEKFKEMVYDQKEIIKLTHLEQLSRVDDSRYFQSI